MKRLFNDSHKRQRAGEEEVGGKGGVSTRNDEREGANMEKKEDSIETKQN